MAGRLENDALKIFRLYISVAILVEEMEGLTNSLSLQTSQHLCELRICHVMSLLLSPNVQRCPFAVPVERYTVYSFIELIQLFEVIKLDYPGTTNVEQSKGNLILGIRLG